MPATPAPAKSPVTSRDTEPTPAPTAHDPRRLPLLGACGCGSGCSCGCQSGSACQCGGGCG
ncbi:hypothetical protein ACFV3R_24580 [Streptomyces sp. NPDC059740]|uniref:hypothetical protein n=1 Tax=Streptomyces sp. NPDC059740 TaxID=3346926 RepID=UPI0036576F86